MFEMFTRQLRLRLVMWLITPEVLRYIDGLIAEDIAHRPTMKVDAR